MSVTPIEYAEVALSRITQQYRDKPRFTSMVQQVCGLVQSNIEEPLSHYFTLYDIDTAEGSNLDVIGEIVGQDRQIISYANLTFFGFDGAPDSDTFGSVYDSGIGSRFLSVGEDNLTVPSATTILSDPEYRIFIRARILRNYSASTPEDIIESIRFIFGVDQVEYTEGIMEISLISLSGSIDNNTLQLVQDADILPRPTGVGIGAIDTYSPIAADAADDWGSGPLDYWVWE
jgi:hypothetical protein